MKRLATAIGCALVISVSLAMATSSGGLAQERPVGPVTSIGQKNGVTAGVVENLNVYGAPEPSPVRQRLTAAMVSQHVKMNQAVANNGAPVYSYLLDNQNLATRSPTGEPRAYLFFAEETPSTEPVYGAVGCAVSERVVVRGWSGYISTGGDRRFHIDPITNPNDPMLRALCRGLGLSASSLPDHADLGAGRELDMFEYLSKSMSFAGFILMPGHERGQLFEEAAVRYRWAAAVRPLYADTANLFERLQSPSTMMQISALETGQSASIPFEVPDDYWTISMNDPYSEQAVADLGADLREMDEAWLNFISSAAVTVRGRRIPLAAEGRVSQVVPTFSLREVGSIDFWAAHGDLLSLTQQMNCVSGRFLIEGGYASASEVPGAGGCPLYRAATASN